MNERQPRERRQYVRFAFYRIDPAWRRLDGARREEETEQFCAAIERFGGRMMVRPYSLVGYRSDADFLLWQVVEDLSVLRAFAATINQARLSEHLHQAYAFLSMTRRSIYRIDAEGGEDHDRTVIAPSAAPYLFVYPFVKTRAWYALPKTERQAMMNEHIRVGRQYPNVKINTTYSYGLDDQEFVVAFETDDPPSFLDLVAELRETEASRYTLRDTPMFTCEALPLRAILRAVGAPAADVSLPLISTTPTKLNAADHKEQTMDWQPTVHQDTIPPGTSRLVHVAGEPVALWNVDGELFAIENRCTHARGNLCDGTLEGATVVCPKHSGRFDLRTGAPVGGPVIISIATYPVRLAADGTIEIAARADDSTPDAVAPHADGSGQGRAIAPTTSASSASASPTEADLDLVDRKLLNLLQWEFPLVARPFAALAEHINAQIAAESADILPVDEAAMMARVERLRARTIIRQLSAIFDTRKLGYQSSLVAMRVAPDHLDEAALIINEHPGVSHNYRRDNHFNLWFTLAVPPEEDLDAALAALARRVGAEVVRKLPNLKMYKIAVKLDMEHDERTIDRRDEAPHYEKHPRALTARDRRLIGAVQNDLPTTSNFFAAAAAQARVTVDELFAWMEEMQRYGYLRRFAAILRHQEAGFTANGMITWKVPEDRVDAVGYQAAAFPQVSHCYRRPVYPDWPYNVFSMVHARSRESCEEIARQMSSELGVAEYIILYSTHEYKKTRVEYFGQGWDAWSLAAGEGAAWADLDRRIAAGEFAHGPTTWRERHSSVLPAR